MTQHVRAQLSASYIVIFKRYCLESRHKRNTTSFSSRADCSRNEDVSGWFSLVGFSALSFLEWLDLVDGRASGL